MNGVLSFNESGAFQKTVPGVSRARQGSRRCGWPSKSPTGEIRGGRDGQGRTTIWRVTSVARQSCRVKMGRWKTSPGGGRGQDVAEGVEISTHLRRDGRESAPRAIAAWAASRKTMSTVGLQRVGTRNLGAQVQCGGFRSMGARVDRDARRRVGRAVCCPIWGCGLWFFSIEF